MKRIIFIAYLLLTATVAFSQSNAIMNLYAGAGASTTLNYDVGVTGGFSYEKQLGQSRTYIGGTLFYQGYAFLYDREANYVTNGGGNAGVTILNKSSYIFIAPKISQLFGRNGLLEAYANVGAGFKMSGTETMRKWDFRNGSAAGNYDSLINTTANINSLVLRVGVGLTEYVQLSGKSSRWFFTITEDAGFLSSSLSKSSDVDYPSRTYYSPNGKLNPNYFSLMIGISRMKKITVKE